MKIAIYGNEVKESYVPIYRRIKQFMELHRIETIVSERINESLLDEFNFNMNAPLTFGNTIDSDVTFILSIGGDGTFLSSLALALQHNTPVAGINCGRLGFLAAISDENLEEALLQLINQEYSIEYRTLIEIATPSGLFNGFNYALNEITVHKLDNSSMIQIETYINGEFLANYWADGLIIGTPTGSTAYSLSVGGPIIAPELEGLIITPIAPHNLTVRPVIVPDRATIEMRVSGRGQQFMVSFDHRSAPLDFSAAIQIRKANKKLPVVKLNGQSFYTTLRNKMMWGIDTRN